ncbi:MAG: mandelate racemase [Chloroflexi bacterium]|nr:mandelate racemase [Chloroflexota bacterium]
MRSAAVTITGVRDAVVSVGSPMRNAYVSFSTMTCSVIAVEARRGDRQFFGFGYTSNGRYAQSGLLRDRFIPRLLAADPAALADEAGDNLDPRAMRRIVMADEKPGGHGERSVAVGGLEMAIWDLAAKVAGEPGHVFIARRYGEPAPVDAVNVYAAGGYYQPDAASDQLRHELRRYLDLGYAVVKMKIGGATLAVDLKRIDAAVGEAATTGGSVAVDANGAFDLGTALAYGRALSERPVRWFEEPVDPLDYHGLAEVAAAVTVPLATGENLFSLPDVRNLLRFGGMDPRTAILQMDAVLGYGLAEYRDMIDAGKAFGWSRSQFVPHGGNHLNLAATAAFGLGACEVYPTKFQPFGVVDARTRVDDGRLRLPDIPGLGLERRADLMAAMRGVLD